VSSFLKQKAIQCLKRLSKSGRSWKLIEMTFYRTDVQARQLPVQPHCANVGRIRRQADLNSLPLGKLVETTRMPPYYVTWNLNSTQVYWNQWTSPSTKQLMWLRIVHSGDWCLCLALRPHSDACQEMNDEW